MCLGGDKGAVTEWLFQQLTPLNFCKISCHVYWDPAEKMELGISDQASFAAALCEV